MQRTQVKQDEQEVRQRAVALAGGLVLFLSCVGCWTTTQPAARQQQQNTLAANSRGAPGRQRTCRDPELGGTPLLGLSILQFRAQILQQGEEELLVLQHSLMAGEGSWVFRVLSVYYFNCVLQYFLLWGSRMWSSRGHLCCWGWL